MISGYKVMMNLSMLKTISNKRIWALFLPISQRQYLGHPTYHITNISIYNTLVPDRRLRFHTNFNILEFHDHFWNRTEKYIPLSTNMAGIGSLIREIDVKFQKCEQAKNNNFVSVKPMPTFQVLIIFPFPWISSRNADMIMANTRIPRYLHLTLLFVFFVTCVATRSREYDVMGLGFPKKWRMWQ